MLGRFLSEVLHSRDVIRRGHRVPRRPGAGRTAWPVVPSPRSRGQTVGTAHEALPGTRRPGNGLCQIVWMGSTNDEWPRSQRLSPITGGWEVDQPRGAPPDEELLRPLCLSTRINNHDASDLRVSGAPSDPTKAQGLSSDIQRIAYERHPRAARAPGLLDRPPSLRRVNRRPSVSLGVLKGGGQLGHRNDQALKGPGVRS
jgi:hypothetical protein